VSPEFPEFPEFPRNSGIPRNSCPRNSHVEFHDDIRIALQREHTIKHWPREWKLDLIRASNPEWKDLHDQLMDGRVKPGHDDGEGQDTQRSPALTLYAHLAVLHVMAGLDPAIHPSAKERRRFHATEKMSGGWVYIMANKPYGTLYVGVTSDIARRAWEHRDGVAEGFTKRYGLKLLVHVEFHDDIRTAIQREHSIKHWPREWKLDLIRASNPEWKDLYDQLN
jgi:putative endonuclease